VSLDSLANHSFGWNEELFLDVHRKTLVVNGVTGSYVGSRMGRLPCFGDVVITPKSKVNAIALCDAEKFKVTYHQGVKYVVQISNDFALEFKYCKQDRSYTCLFTNEILQTLYNHEQGIMSINTITFTVNENWTAYSDTY
jgi:hypothetical protein